MKILGFILVLLLGFCLITPTVPAAIEKINIEVLFANQISSIKRQSIVYVENLISLRNRAQEIVTLYGNQLDVTDKDKLPNLKTKIDIAIADLQIVIDYIRTEFPNLN